MRIVLVTAVYPPRFGGGAGKAVASLAQALVRQGDHVAVVTLHPGRTSAVEERAGVRVYSLPLDNVDWPFGRERRRNALARALWHGIDLWNPMAARRFGRILDGEKPDVVHTHILAGFSVAIWREAKRRGIRLVHTMHDYYMLCERSALYRAGQVCEKRCLPCTALTWAKRHSSGMVDAVLSVSEYVQQRHLNCGYFPHAACAVVHNVSPLPDASGNDRQPRGGETVFGFIGRLEPEKGIDQLLRATRRLNGSSWRLLIAGNANTFYARHLRHTFQNARVEWLGMQSPAEFYRKVDVVVIPSQFPDPFPYVALESLQHGKPVIAAAAGGIPEILRLGRCIQLFEPRDEAALAACMQEALAGTHDAPRGGFRDPDLCLLFSEEAIVQAHRRMYHGQLPGAANEAQTTHGRELTDGIHNPVL